MAGTDGFGGNNRPIIRREPRIVRHSCNTRRQLCGTSTLSAGISSAIWLLDSGHLGGRAGWWEVDHDHAYDSISDCRPDARRLHAGDAGAGDSSLVEAARQGIDVEPALRAGDDPRALSPAYRQLRPQGNAGLDRHR